MTTTTKHLTRLTPSDLAAELTTNTKTGLTAKEAAARLQQNGRNQLTAAKKPSLLRQIGHHLSDITSLILLFAVGLSAYLAQNHCYWRHRHSQCCDRFVPRTQR